MATSYEQWHRAADGDTAVLGQWHVWQKVLNDDGSVSSLSPGTSPPICGADVPVSSESFLEASREGRVALDDMCEACRRYHLAGGGL